MSRKKINFINEALLLTYLGNIFKAENLMLFH